MSRNVNKYNKKSSIEWSWPSIFENHFTICTITLFYHILYKIVYINKIVGCVYKIVIEIVRVWFSRKPITIKLYLKLLILVNALRLSCATDYHSKHYSFAFIDCVPNIFTGKYKQNCNYAFKLSNLNVSTANAEYKQIAGFWIHTKRYWSDNERYG